MLLPRNLSSRAEYVVYPILCFLHGLFYGVLYAPAQALLFHMDLTATLAWIAAGFSFDVIHAVSNFAVGFLVPPLVLVLRRLYAKTQNL